MVTPATTIITQDGIMIPSDTRIIGIIMIMGIMDGEDGITTIQQLLFITIITEITGTTADQEVLVFTVKEMEIAQLQTAPEHDQEVIIQEILE